MIDVNIMPLARLMGIRLVEHSPDKVVAEMAVGSSGSVDQWVHES